MYFEYFGNRCSFTFAVQIELDIGSKYRIVQA